MHQSGALFSVERGNLGRDHRIRGEADEHHLKRRVSASKRILRDEASPPRGGPVGEALERWDKEGDECKRKRGSSFCILYTR